MRFLLILIFTSQIAVAQQKVITDCNTVFICIDTSSYQQLFKNSYIKDTLFFCRATSTSTNKEDYVGKYLIGQAATMEFFKPNDIDKIGNHFNDFGIEFKTRAVGMLNQLYKKAVKQSNAFDTSSTQINTMDTSLAWYKALTVHPPKANFEWSILEYEKSYLAYIGFEKEALTKPMTYAAYNKKLSNGRPYPRQFNTIKSIYLQIDSTSLFYLNIYCTLNGLNKKNNSYYNSNINITYQIVAAPQKAKITKIVFDLINPQPTRSIKISTNLQCNINNKMGEFVWLN